MSINLFYCGCIKLDLINNNNLVYYYQHIKFDCLREIINNDTDDFLKDLAKVFYEIPNIIIESDDICYINDNEYMYVYLYDGPLPEGYCNNIDLCRFLIVAYSYINEFREEIDIH